MGIISIIVIGWSLVMLISKVLTSGLSALVTIFMVLAGIGCAQNITWNKPGATQQEFNQDNYVCTKAAQQYTAPTSTPYPQGQMVSGQYVAPSWSQNLNAALNNSSGGYSTNNNLYRGCMQSKGYSPRQGR